MIGTNKINSKNKWKGFEDFLVYKTVKEAQRKWNNTTINARAEILYKASDILLENIDELSELMMREIAKGRKSCRSEVSRTADFVSGLIEDAKGKGADLIVGGNREVNKIFN
ncbi:aldehyde dehydrogenase [Clostridium carboxidivorans P7]|uniref:NAD-dependent aldehyde dehydrogenase-like protein n=1 Tax=Clostridium carboxidivorans P7 TaxID=536227 RepID=C6PSG4_9CLOT|nr:aldehyde dehydrogenase family protein [Clostridium carboxidivorans]AKN32579.1 aldehyde dehydrogenase [Clostridium carboxidivorans P7]EET87842.1 NAD-dependent aldehyde dehydrogenase-like protein [Clostridium carboxidivorans P7]EFG90213.1 hypothetical protein CLCAR_0419 [Clostridium carboxidivorans P7]